MGHVEMGGELARRGACALRRVSRDHQQVAAREVRDTGNRNGLGEVLERIERGHLRRAGLIVR
jgi:hypothetical protein